MNEGYELYTVRQAAAMLRTSEGGVRRRGKGTPPGFIEAVSIAGPRWGQRK